MRNHQPLTGFEIFGLKPVFVHDGAHARAVARGNGVKSVAFFDAVGGFAKTAALHFTHGQAKSLTDFDHIALEAVLLSDIRGFNTESCSNGR